MVRRFQQIPHQKDANGKKAYGKIPNVIIRRKILVKSTMRYHFIPIRMVHKQKTDNGNAGNSPEVYKLSFIAGKNAYCSEHFVKHFNSFL
jgi:hypothetical protein